MSQRQLRRQTGFTLVEVMICLLILAFGLLGMTALQNDVLKYNHAAFTESQALFLINDMAERIRANPNDAYVLAYTELPPTQTIDCSANNCDSNSMATWDLNQWRAKVTDNHYLPSGQSQILYDYNTHAYVISIKYDWSQLGSLDADNGIREVTVTSKM
ncbi:MAG TPA: type IV pilus modification protein PilV [Candidatus Acidoferrum sp.]|nr:type IV pilus modification protein PilV [Candidatus Acidoferrum sp.]